MDESQISQLSLEAAASALLIAVAYKIWRLRCHSDSKCCGDAVHFSGDNPGAAV